MLCLTHNAFKRNPLSTSHSHFHSSNFKPENMCENKHAGLQFGICVSSIVTRSSFVLVHRDRPGSPFKHKEIGNVCRCEITMGVVEVFFCHGWKKLQVEEPRTHGQIPDATLIDLVTMRFKQKLLDVFMYSNPSQPNSSVHFHSCIVPEPS